MTVTPHGYRVYAHKTMASRETDGMISARSIRNWKKLAKGYHVQISLNQSLKRPFT